MAYRTAGAGIAHNPHELGIIARADRDTAFIWLGRGNKHRVECATEPLARVEAQRLANAHRKPAMIYAVAGQASVLVCTITPNRTLTG